MGIQGLHKGLSFATQKTTLNDFRGKTVAIDSSSWLHRSVYSVSKKYVEGIERNEIDPDCVRASSRYIISRVQELLDQFHIAQVFLVMDGERCPLKADTNGERERRRQANLKEARDWERKGQTYKAEEKYKMCIKIKDELTKAVMKEVRRRFTAGRRVHQVWSPYEADAQLAKLCIDGVADAVITEDSDVLVYSAAAHCPFPVIYKLDRKSGACDVISMDWLLNYKEDHYDATCGAKAKPALETLLRNLASREAKRPGFGARLFVQGCVLAGCDYAPNKLVGVGLVNAFKHVRDNAFRNDSKRFQKVLESMPRKNKVNIDVKAYEEVLAQSEAVFYYHIVKYKDQTLQPLCQPRVEEPSDDTEHSQEHHFPLMTRFEDWSFVGKSKSADSRPTAPTKSEQPPAIHTIEFSRGNIQVKSSENLQKKLTSFIVTKQVGPTRNPYSRVTKSSNNGTTSRKRPRNEYSARIPLKNIDPNDVILEASDTSGNENSFSVFERKPLSSCPLKKPGSIQSYQKLDDPRCVKRKFSPRRDSSHASKGLSPIGFEYNSVPVPLADIYIEAHVEGGQIKAEVPTAMNSTIPVEIDDPANALPEDGGIPNFFDLTDSNSMPIPTCNQDSMDGFEDLYWDNRDGPNRVSLDGSLASAENTHDEHEGPILSRDLGCMKSKHPKPFQPQVSLRNRSIRTSPYFSTPLVQHKNRCSDADVVDSPEDVKGYSGNQIVQRAHHMSSTKSGSVTWKKAQGNRPMIRNFVGQRSTSTRSKSLVQRGISTSSSRSSFNSRVGPTLKKTPALKQRTMKSFFVSSGTKARPPSLNHLKFNSNQSDEQFLWEG